MRFSRSTLHVVRRPFARPVGNARTSWTARESLILQLHDTEGRIGQGEAAPLPGYSLDPLPAVSSALLGVHARIGSPALEAELSDLPSARFALETAILDLEGQRRGLAMSALLGASSGAPVARSGLVDSLDPAKSARALIARGLQTLKIKVGKGLPEDVASVTLLRETVGSLISLRLDANGAWSVTQARENLARLAHLGIELVEEPTAGAGLLALGTCAIPWAADESLRDRALAAALLDDPACTVFVLKPQLLGLLRARDLAALAIARGKTVIVTHLFDGPIAMAAACELALSLSVAPLACGLDLHPGLGDENDVDLPHLATRGFIVPSPLPGLGLALIEAAA